MIKVITTTTIYPPSPALLKFAAMDDWQLVIAGDLKTPEMPYLTMGNDRVHYLAPAIQESFDNALSQAIGWNCIQRRNFAFLFACKELKADIIATIDDDNIPNDGWGENLFIGTSVLADKYIINEATFDPLMVTNHTELWHRGYPLELVKDRWKALTTVQEETLTCKIQADLWDGEADVDAVCRLTHQTSGCMFKHPRRLYTSNKPSPFNSQNTFLTKEVMPHYFMFPDIGRMDDIWAAYHVQAQGFRVHYGGPTVVQKRNEHNIVNDLLNEIVGMQNNLAIVKEVPTNKNAVLDRLPRQSVEAFRLYQKHFE